MQVLLYLLDVVTATFLLTSSGLKYQKIAAVTTVATMDNVPVGVSILPNPAAATPRGLMGVTDGRVINGRVSKVKWIVARSFSTKFGLETVCVLA